MKKILFTIILNINNYLIKLSNWLTSLEIIKKGIADSEKKETRVIHYLENCYALIIVILYPYLATALRSSLKYMAFQVPLGCIYFTFRS